MTREEALVQLRIGPGINEDVSEEYNEAVDIAIKALEQQPSENEQIIKVSKGVLKARTGRFVIYDVEWLKENFNTTEAKIYGQPCEDCISRKAAIDGLASIAKAKAKSDSQKSLMGRVMFFTEHLPSVTPQPKAEGARGGIPLQQSVPKMPQPKEHTEERTETHEKTGHWEWVQYESKPNFGNWHCSECHCILCGAINGNPIRLPKYCPECGSYNGGNK